ncbi:MAG: tail fiber domain-containing protein [Rhizobium sp.]|nr:MAG: tail fiber domain-containing protein [Rhizobium sp.]
MGFLKPKPAKSSSENTNNALLTSTYTPQAQQGVQANNFLGALLTGKGDVAGARGGLSEYLKMTGFEPALRQLSRGITGQGAASGLLRSGSTANALLTRGAELNQGFTNNYLGQLLNLSNAGTQAGGIIANAGQKSTSTGGGPSTAGSIASTVGGIASIFSDRRLKKDIVKVGEMSDGLGIYRFRYIGGVKRFVGVMADEVARLRPWALGPTLAGFRTVNMGAL